MDKFYLIDAFVGDGAKGNPCAVVFVDDLSDAVRLQEIAVVLNQPATTFLQPQEDGGYKVRWFAPESEIDLCGHGSLAAVWLLAQQQPERSEFSLTYSKGEIVGHYREGFVTIAGDAILSEEQGVPEHVRAGFKSEVLSYHHNWNKPIVVLKDVSSLEMLAIDWPALEASETVAYVLTAKDAHGPYDFQSRVILPHLKKREDQATGSAQMVLTPYWSTILNKQVFKAFQCSARGGRMDLSYRDGKVGITTQCRYRGMGELI
jgi:predicted PhzF superfamily epimerase YddE/YHI9